VDRTRVRLPRPHLTRHDDRIEAARKIGERELRALDRGRAVGHQRETIGRAQLVEDAFRVGVERL